MPLLKFPSVLRHLYITFRTCWATVQGNLFNIIYRIESFFMFFGHAGTQNLPVYCCELGHFKLFLLGKQFQNTFRNKLLLQILLHNPFIKCWVTEKRSMFGEIQNSFAQIWDNSIWAWRTWKVSNVLFRVNSCLIPLLICCYTFKDSLKSIMFTVCHITVLVSVNCSGCCYFENVFQFYFDIEAHLLNRDAILFSQHFRYFVA